jgi:hypothetical protein
MHKAVRQQHEAFFDLSPTLEPIGPKQLARMLAEGLVRTTLRALHWR